MGLFSAGNLNLYYRGRLQREKQDSADADRNGYQPMFPNLNNKADEIEKVEDKGELGLARNLDVQPRLTLGTLKRLSAQPTDYTSQRYSLLTVRTLLLLYYLHLLAAYTVLKLMVCLARTRNLRLDRPPL